MSRFMYTRFQDMEAYTPGEQPQDKQYIKLNTNESPFPPAPQVIAAMTDEEVANLRLYPDPEGKVLKQKLAALYNLKPENVFLSNGSDDILNFAFMAFRGVKGVAFADITYGFYDVFAKLHDIPSEIVPLKDDFTVDPTAYMRDDRMVVLANPNAPTGISLSVEAIEDILRANPHNVVLIDEAYVDFGGESCYPLIDRYDNLLVVRTYSKSRCLAGGRLGYAFGNPALIEDLEKIRYSTNPYSINRLTLRLGEITVDENDYYVQKCAEIIRVREWTKEQLKAIGFEVLDSDANFLFARHAKVDGATLYNGLKEAGVLVRHFTKSRIAAFNRITIGTAEQMQRFIDIVRLLIKE